MKRVNVYAAIALMSVLVSGCTAVGVNPPVASSPLPTKTESSTNITVGLDRCSDTVKVLAVGNSGESGKADPEIEAAFDGLRMRVVNHITLSVPSFEGDNEKVPSPVDAPDFYKNSEYYPKARKAADAVFRAVDESQKSCPGSRVVLMGHGIGASALHLVAAEIQSDESQHVSAVWLISDPDRNSGSNNSAVFTGDSTDPILNDGTAGKVLTSNGVRGIDNGFGPLKGKVADVCVPDDMTCNWDLKFVSTEKVRNDFIASRGGLNALHTLKKPYTDYMFNIAIGYWVSALIFGSDATATSTDQSGGGPTNDSPLQKYLSYVNHNADGALVVQDEIDNPEKITSCDADYAVLSLRGSGEHLSGNAIDDNGVVVTNPAVNGVTYNGGIPSNGGPIIDGFPQFLATYAWKIKTELPASKRIRFIPIRYSAVALEGSLLMKNFKNDIPGYFRSASQGEKLLKNKVTELISKCPDTKIVVMGYSQGAQAVHQSLRLFTDEEVRKTSAVILIADPLRRGDDPVPHSYDPKNYPDQEAPRSSKLYSSNGMMGDDTSLALLPEVNKSFVIPESFRGKVYEVCDTDDKVCNGEVVLRDIVVGSLPQHAVEALTHVIAYRFKDHYDFPAKWAAHNLME